ncbi:MAG: hypothetical protein ACJA09_004120 [Alcanivorax sp.]|jgi:hypothetical protein
MSSCQIDGQQKILQLTHQHLKGHFAVQAIFYARRPATAFAYSRRR